MSECDAIERIRIYAEQRIEYWAERVHAVRAPALAYQDMLAYIERGEHEEATHE